MEAWTWDPEDLSLTIRFLRALRGWTQTRLAQEAGLDKSRISLLESGTHTPDRELLQRLAAAVGLPLHLLDLSLPMLSSFRQVLALPPSSPDDEEETAGLVKIVVAEMTAAAHAFTLRTALELSLAPDEERWSYQPGDRDGVEELYRNLEPGPQEERLFAIKEGTEFRRWALAERFCAESEKSAESDPARALELAETAVEIARSLSGPEDWRAHVEGYCLAFLGNAQKAAGRLDEAKQTQATAWKLWSEWTPDPELLQESRLRDLQATRASANRG